MRHAAELFEKCGAAHRFRRGAAAGRHGPAHLAGKRAGRRGDGPLPAGAGGVFAVHHAGNGGRFGGGYPAHGRGTQRPGFRPWCSPRHAAPSAGGRTCAGAVCRCTAAGNSGSCGPVVAWRCPCRRCFARFSAGNAVDGGFVGAARFFHRPTACGPQCVQPAYGADGAHRAGGTGAYPHRGPCGGRALYAGAGSYRRQRSGVGAVHAGLLPAGCPQCLCGAKSRPPGRPCPPSVGDPVAGGGRAGVGKRPAHGGEYAGARLPCGLSDQRGRAHRRAGAVRRTERHGSAAAYVPIWPAGQSFGAADAGDHAGSYSGPNRTAQRTFEPDAAAHRLFFRAGRGAVLGVGTAAGTAFVPKCGCRVLSGNAGSCHAADVSGKHGGRCHERGRRAEGGLPLQRVGFHPAHWRGGGAAAALWHEGLFGSDPAFQPVHLCGQHRASAVFQRHAACIPPLAGCTGTGSPSCRFLQVYGNP